MKELRLSDLLLDLPRRTFRPKEFLYYAREEPPPYLFFLNRGFVRQYIDSSEGKELIIHIFEKSAIFPLTWGINNSLFDYNLQAMTLCEVTLVPKTKLVSYLKKHPESSYRLIQNLLSGIEGLTRRIELVSLDNASAQVKSTLLYLAKHFGRKKSGHIIINHYFTHEEIGSFIGLTRERVSLELGKLKKEKIITYDKNQIRILNLEELTELSQ